jgi:hypothetical protein
MVTVVPSEAVTLFVAQKERANNASREDLIIVLLVLEKVRGK